MTTKQETPEVTITVSQPYHVVGFQGGRYGASQFTKRDYTADVLGKRYQNTSKSEIQSVIRAAFYRATGSNRVRFTFVQEG
jgi:hypothetical protein